MVLPAVLVTVYVVVSLAVTFANTGRERYVFPISAMPMFRGMPDPTPEQARRLEAFSEGAPATVPAKEDPGG